MNNIAKEPIDMHTKIDEPLIPNYLASKQPTIVLMVPGAKDHFTYKLVSKGPGLWYVYYMGEKRIYIGSMRRNASKQFNYRSSDQSIINDIDIDAIHNFDALIEYANSSINDLNLEVHHDGTCGRCGKPLTDPESMARGLGPICARS